MKILRKVKIMAEGDCNVLRFKRVWINKAIDDYGRPLGVPESPDRIYGHLLTRIIEAYLIGTNQIPSNQQGGLSKRGVLTFLRKLAENFHLNERIFEFDIKGYFDHINHSSILSMFKSKVIGRYLKGVLKNKPTDYKLPIIEKDIATQKYMYSIRQSAMMFMGTKNMINYQIPSPVKKRLGTKVMSEEIMTEAEKFFGVKATRPGIKISLAKSLAGEYKGLMGRQVMVDPFATMQLPTERQREIGRDRWKDLDLPGKGVPQGSSFGPIIASVLLGQIMPENALLYMDDGIIFLGNSRVTKGTMMSRINNRLSRIGCELSPEKSGILTTNKLWKEGLKIIGMRIKRTIFTGMNIVSETRAGITKPFFEFTKENVERMLREMYDRKMITLSKYKVLRWYARSGKLDVMNQSPLIQLTERLGLLGAIVSRAFSPTVDLEDMKRQIEYGIWKAELKLKSSRGSLGERIINMTKTILIETTEGEAEVRPNLYNARSIANNVLLKYLKGEPPVRALRIQGMRKPFNKESLIPSKKK
jgi:hypothetical protein